MELAYEVTYEKTADAVRMGDGTVLRYTFSCFREEFVIIQPSGSRYFTKRLCCPSDIRAHHDQNTSEVVVRFVETHFGHSNLVVEGIMAKHAKALNAETVCSLEVTDSGWTVWMDGNAGQSHFVRDNNSLCHCNLRCDECGVCVHTFKCDCNEYLSKPTVCEHIHLIATYLKAGNSEETEEPVDCKPTLAAMALPGKIKMEGPTVVAKGLADALDTMDVLYSGIRRDVRNVEEAAIVVEGLSEMISKFESLRSEAK
ncbi:unnamed protein product [Nesidiocoris tenuis]|uniref:SWIM-type domain-containing protein n=1 Tax=Nesidiocoris tenuis TaxID=355587 RepID=A0A6H5HI60_9HEMI|nr:unnamed protein product [Nesidiocoris tenuis]